MIQKVPGTFDLDIPGLGFLDNNAGSDVCLSTPLTLTSHDVLADQSWYQHLAPSVAGRDACCLVSLVYSGTPLKRVNSCIRTHHQANPLLTLDLPPSLSSRVLNALKADPVSVDLRNLTPHFYRLAERCLQLYYEEEIVEILLDVCALPCIRYRRSRTDL